MQAMSTSLLGLTRLAFCHHLSCFHCKNSPSGFGLLPWLEERSPNYSQGASRTPQGWSFER